MKFSLWNNQSVRNRTACFTDYISSKNVDLCALTETGLTDSDAAIKCTPECYKLFGESRSDRKSGGMVYRSNILAQKIEVGARKSLKVSEIVLLSMQLRSSWSMRLAVIYKPRCSSTHPVTFAAFLSEFADYLESFVTCTELIINSGDFDLHVDNANDSSAAVFMELA